MKKIMISQPMRDKTPEEIEKIRNESIAQLESQGYSVIDTYFVGDWFSQDAITEREVIHIPVAFLAKSIEYMSYVNAVYFCKGWETARGCIIEHSIAEAYGIDIIYEI